jgi:hypothetical protein
VIGYFLLSVTLSRRSGVKRRDFGLIADCGFSATAPVRNWSSLAFEQDPTDFRLPILTDLTPPAAENANLFEQLSQILKHGVFFVGARAIS